MQQINGGSMTYENMAREDLVALCRARRGEAEYAAMSVSQMAMLLRNADVLDALARGESTRAQSEAPLEDDAEWGFDSPAPRSSLTSAIAERRATADVVIGLFATGCALLIMTLILAGFLGLAILGWRTLTGAL